MHSVHDISKYSPTHTDKFFVDTNVWFWFTYAGSKEITTDSAPVRYQIEKYPKFIEAVLDAGARLFHCSLTLAEISNVIENTEYELYCKSKGVSISKKNFRRIPEERTKVMKEIETAWRSIKSVSENLDAKLCRDFNEEAISLLKKSYVDANDAFFINVMKQNSIQFILTDDNDFSTLDTSKIFTANNKTLS
jgi:predicted nucleic acid-binding protein